MSSLFRRGRAVGALGLGALSLAASTAPDFLGASSCHDLPAKRDGVLEHKIDHYNGVNITKVDMEDSVEKFAEKLASSIEKWRKEDGPLFYTEPEKVLELKYGAAPTARIAG